MTFGAFVAPPSELEGSARRNDWISIGELVAGWAQPRSSSTSPNAQIASRTASTVIEAQSIYAASAIAAAPAIKPAQKTPRVSPPNVIRVIHLTTVSLMFSSG